MNTVTITIGLNSNATLSPLRRVMRERFIKSVRASVADNSAAIFADAAPHDGSWTDESTGQIVHERSRTWVALADAEQVENLRARLAILAGQFEQDAIALTVGETTLVS